MVYFNEMPDYSKLIWIFFCMSFMLIIESIIPLFKGGFRSRQHFSTNLIFLATVVACNLIIGVFTVGLYDWLDTNNWGLLNLVEGAVWIELLASFLILDLISQYFAHWSVHNVKPLWRLHLVHHSDTHVDATTGLRLHPLDYLVRESFAILAVFLLDAPFAYYLMYRFGTIACSHFNHANIRLPLAVDKAMSWVFISPNMHKFHHHYEVPWTDTNYGQMFSIWDRLFGTYYYGDVDQIKYGLDVTDMSKANDVKYQAMLPFTNNGREKFNIESQKQ